MANGDPQEGDHCGSFEVATGDSGTGGGRELAG